jgi:hypothetical protein
VITGSTSRYECTCTGLYSGTHCDNSQYLQIAIALPVSTLLVTVIVIVVSIRVKGRQKEMRSLLELQEFLLTEAATSMLELEELRKTWEIAADDIALLGTVGRGAYGVVYRGRWRDMDVAVKALVGSYLSEEELRQELDREASMLQVCG